MMRAGCLVFVPDSGGQVESVRLPELRYRSTADAVEKIGRLLGDESASLSLRARLMKDAGEFTAERFRERFRAIVAEEVARAASPAGP